MNSLDNQIEWSDKSRKGISSQSDFDYSAEHLIAYSPYRDKIAYLSVNQLFGDMEVIEDTFSNCRGTVVFLLGAEELIKKIEETDESALIDRINAHGDKIYKFAFPEKIRGEYERPGCVGMASFGKFLEDYALEIQNPQPGDIVSFENKELADKISYHAAIYLGEIDGTKFSFGQDGQGGRFVIKSVNEWEIEYLAKAYFYRFKILLRDF